MTALLTFLQQRQPLHWLHLAPDSGQPPERVAQTQRSWCSTRCYLGPIGCVPGLAEAVILSIVKAWVDLSTDTWSWELLIVTILKPHFPCLTALMDRDIADDCRDGAVDACNDSLCEFDDI